MHRVMPESISARPFRDEDDWWRVRGLIIELFPLVPAGVGWEIRRWDGRRFHSEHQWEWAVMKRCRLWFADERLVAAACSEGTAADVHLLVRPDHRGLEGEMLDWAIGALSAPRGSHHLHHEAFDDDAHRIGLLEDRGFVRLDERLVVRRRAPTDATVPARMAPAYELRATVPHPDEYRRMADLLNAAFGRASHTAAEYRVFCERTPSFRHDLNLVAEATAGSFAAHAGFTFDVANRCGILEPVCTHPDHRKQGLALALITEGLNRVRALGAEVATVDAGAGPGPNRLYEAAGFLDTRWGHIWRRETANG